MGFLFSFPRKDGTKNNASPILGNLLMSFTEMSNKTWFKKGTVG